MEYLAYSKINEQVENFKNERGLKDEDIFIHAFPQTIKDEISNKMILKQIVILVDKDDEFARIFVDGEELFELFGLTNKFFIDLNNRCISMCEKDYF